MISRKFQITTIIHTQLIDGVIKSSEDYLRLLSKLKINRPKTIIEAKQTHSTNLSIITQKTKNMTKIENCDGLMTNLYNTALLIKTADCIPVIFYDSKNHAIAAIHAGWRGLVSGIVNKSIQKMNESFGSLATDLQVYIGPSIRSCCYSFTDKPNQINSPLWKPFIVNKNQKWHIDLAGFLISQLIKFGVKNSQITDSKHCTYHENRSWPSHLRSKHNSQSTGSFATVVQLL